MSIADRLPVPPAAASSGRRATGGLARRLPLALLPLAGLAGWQAVVWLARPREWLLPSPAAVAETMWADRGRLWFHAQATIAEAALGLGLAVAAGLLMAVVIVSSGAARRTLYPWVVATQAVPVLAVAPLVAVWLGYGTAQVMVAFLIAVFPVVVTAVDGLRAVDPAAARAVRTLGAGRLWTFRRVTLPAALPSIFSGVRMAAVLAVTGAVVAEYVGADRGLGYFTDFSTAQFQTTRSVAAVVCLAVIGMAFFGAVSLAERLALPHRHRAVRPRWRRP